MMRGRRPLLRRHLLRLALLLAAIAAPWLLASVPVPPGLVAAPSGGAAWAAEARNSTPAHPLDDTALLKALRGGGLIVFFRHGATDFSRDDTRMRDFDDCAHQRMLSDQGRAGLRAIARQWQRLALPVGRVLASPYCRTRESAELLFGRYERADAVRGGPLEEGADRYVELRKIFASRPEPGKLLVVVSHANPFHAVAGPPYLGEAEAAVLRPLGTGRWEVIARVTPDAWARLH